MPDVLWKKSNSVFPVAPGSMKSIRKSLCNFHDITLHFFNLFFTLNVAEKQRICDSGLILL